MENINFIPANELPATEAEEVEVLCLDAGELKRKPAANLGGGGGGYCLKVSADQVTTDGTANTITANRDEMVLALEKGIPVSILMPANMGGQMLVVPSLWGVEGDALLGIAYVDAAITLTFTEGTLLPDWSDGV